MEDENKQLKQHLLELFSQFDKQDNPMILREISIKAFKLMKNEKQELVCCPDCKEVGLIDNYCNPIGQVIQVFSAYSRMKCENGHHWQHTWKVGDKILYLEPPNQYYVYKCERIVSSYNIEFKRINGVRHFPGRRWNRDRLEYEN